MNATMGRATTRRPAVARVRREPSAGTLAFVLNLPSALCLLLILAWPVLYAGWLSFHDVSLRHLRTGDFPFAGLANYARLVGDEIFWLTLRNTLLFVGISVALEVILALAVALVIDDDRVALSRVTRVLLLVPWGVPPVVNGLLWAFIFNTQYGYLNRALFALGAIHEPVNWLGHPRLALLAVITAYVWRTTPFNILLYHAGLRGIPRDYYEAAEVDGAAGWRTLWHITLPLLRPIIAVSLILRTTFGFMVFDEIFAITQGGPGNATWVAAWYTYRAAFQPPFNVGLGAASAWVMAVILGAAGVAYARLVGRRLEA
jgi:multiple sugar transport system permease protein